MKLNKIRIKIDEVDLRLAKLLNERFLLVEEVKQIKKDENINVENKSREDDVINNNIKHINSEFHEMYKEIYQTIFKTSKEYQKK